MSAGVLPPILLLLAEVNLGYGGNGAEFCLTGFSHPESTHAWGLSPNSSISFRPFRNVRCAFILFEIEPFIPVADYEGLDLWIFVDSEVRQVLKLATRLVVSIRVETRRQLDEGFTINFLCADASHPKDFLLGETRPLAFRLSKVFVYGSTDIVKPTRRVADKVPGSDAAEVAASIFQQTHMTPAELALFFESLGHLCDFGFFQRRLGVDRLSLFRFSGIQIMDIARGILIGFKGLGETFDLHYQEDACEYTITENGFGITSHTHVKLGELEKDEIIERERRRLLYLKRRFMEDLEFGGKVFLPREPALDNKHHIQTLWLALNSIHPVSTAGTLDRASASVGVPAVVGHQLFKAVDSEWGEGPSGGVLGVANPKAPVFRLHVVGDFVQPLFVFPQHLSDAGDGEHVAWRCHA